MKQPDWFVIIKEWRDRRMGKYGVTLPFLYGALCMKYEAVNLHRILRNIIEQPVTGYVIETTWCPDVVKAPVFRATQETSQDRITFNVVPIPNPSTQRPSLIFDNDLATRWKSKDLVDALIEDARPAVESGKYSRHHDDKTGEYFYGDFTEKEIEFIEATIMSSQPERGAYG